MPAYESHRVLVTVKTYPNSSRKYTETVCVAGIDLETGAWIRLYPIPFRDLASWQKFKKYSVIEVKAAKTPSDSRPESYRVDANSIQVKETWGTGKSHDWSRRRATVLQHVTSSLCALQAEQVEKRTSLGIIKPREVSMMICDVDVSDKVLKQDYYNQMPMFGPALQAIEPIPLTFSYSFRCAGDPNCRGHELSILDWELM